MAIKLPVWNNPYIGLPTLVAATLEAKGAEGEAVLRASQLRVGRMSASHLVDVRAVPMNATALEWATFCGHVLRNDGFGGITVGGDASDGLAGGGRRPVPRAVRLPPVAAVDQPHPLGLVPRACCRWPARR